MSSSTQTMDDVVKSYVLPSAQIQTMTTSKDTKRGDNKATEKQSFSYFFSNFASKTVFDKLGGDSDGGKVEEDLKFHSSGIDRVNEIFPLKVEFTGNAGVPGVNVSRRIRVDSPLKLNHEDRDTYTVDLPYSDLQEASDNKDVLLLAAPMKLEGEWLQPFQDAGFHEFTFLDRNTSRIPFMTSKGNKHYLQQFKNFKLLSVPFKQPPDSNDFSMLFYLPDRIEDTDDLQKLIDEFETRMQEVNFPIEQAQVGNFLAPRFAMNVPGDMSHVSGLATDNSTTSLSTARAIFGGFIEINERGVAAVGATPFSIHEEKPEDKSVEGNSGVDLGKTVIPEIDFVANRPFLFFIRDDKLGSLLFGGGLFGSHCVSFRQDKQVAVGPWGGSSGEKWVYHPNNPIKKIIIHHGDVIDSITFVSEDGQQSKIFGGNGGHNRSEVLLDNPKEYLTKITGTFERYQNMQVIKSLKFCTNVSVYGPIGFGGKSSFYIPMESGSIVGFHGRASSYLNAIGIIGNNISLPKVVKQLNNTISIGPRGGTRGEHWVYHPNRPIKKIIIHHEDVIDSIMFVSEDGQQSKRFGGSGGHNRQEVLLDNPKECLMGISATFEQYRGTNVIKSLKFVTNISEYGPFGATGKHAIHFPMESGSIVGFVGRAGSYLNAIGIIMDNSSPLEVVQQVHE